MLTAEFGFVVNEYKQRAIWLHFNYLYYSVNYPMSNNDGNFKLFKRMEV
jgi:hypothetical protein